MKGQMFIIAAIFIIIGVLLVFSLLSVFDLFEESRKTNTRIEDVQLRNIAREYERVAGIAALNQGNVSGISYLSNLSEILRNDLEIRIFYSLVFVNGTTANYSVTLGNYLKSDVDATIEDPLSTPTSANLAVPDKFNQTVHFESSAGEKIITITYSVRNETIREEFALNVTNKNRIQIFYDIEIGSEDIVRKKGLYNTTW